jgi:exopolysaccharide production protein ExoQ
MPPILALMLSLGFSGVLLYREAYQQKNVSRAIWIPCIWLFILGSRPISAWIGYQGVAGMDAMMEGSPVDRLVYLFLMIAALGVVVYRRLKWTEILANNRLLICFIAYCAVSVLWSDYPFIAFKRWFKSLGDPLMALIILSEVNPSAAVGSVLRRCAFVLVPLSIVFIKYFPRLGRGYSDWTGQAYYTGVTTNKNMLGYLLLVFGLLFLCTTLTRGMKERRAEQRTELAISVLMLGMILWLVRMADSKTALVALCVSAGTIFALGSSLVRRYFGRVAIAALVVVLTLQWAFNIWGLVLEAAGRDATLTGRTEIWAEVLKLSQSALVGSGFQSFWLGDRLTAMWARFPVFRPNQAHNGYLEIYLNLGWVGLIVFLCMLGAFYNTMRDRLERAMAMSPVDRTELAIAKFALGYLVAYLVYNVTEAIFQPLNFLFIVFLVLGIRYARREELAARAITWEPARNATWAGGDAAPSVRQWRPTGTVSERFRTPWSDRLTGPTADRDRSHNGGPPGGRSLNPAWTGKRTDLWTPPAKGTDKLPS